MDNTQERIITKSNRMSWIDVIRGICIFLVVFGHLSKYPLFGIYANHIKMPMFYLLTGLFVKPTKSTTVFIKDLAYRLGFPWLIFSLIWLKIPFEIVMKGWSGAFSTFLDFILGKTFWFVPSYFLTQVLFLIIFKLAKGNKAVLVLTSCVFFVIGCFTSSSSIFEIWCMNTSFSGVVFIVLGFLLHDYLYLVEKIKWFHAIIFTVIYLVLGYIGYVLNPVASLDFHNVKYGNPGYNIVLILVGVAFCISVSVYLCRRFTLRMLNVLGRNTLVTYILSSTLIIVMEKSFNFLHISIDKIMDQNFIVVFIIAVIICSVCAIVSEVCGYFAPWSVGLKKRIR